MWRLYFYIFTLLLSLNLYGWTSGLQDAVKAVVNGSATPEQKLFVHIHRAEVSQMGLSNSQFQKISAKVEKSFILQNNLRIKNAAELAGFNAQTKAPKNKFTPGADTDVNVIPKDPNHIITLDDIKTIEANYENMLRAECKENGLDYDAYKKSRNTDTDFMAHPDYTTDEEFKKIADHINNEKGGTAYNTRDAARAELKLAKGETPTPNEIGAYTSEMKWQMNRKNAKTSKLYKELVAAKKANDLSSVQKISTEIKLINGQKAKYISKTRQLNNQIRKSYGLKPEPYAIDGADAAADVLTAPGGRAAPFSKEASLIGATSDSAMLRAQEKLADSLIQAAQKTPAARRALSGILNELPPSAQSNLISKMEQELGARASADVIKGAKALRVGLNPVVESIKKAMRNDLNFGSPGLAPKPKWGTLSKTQKIKATAKYGLRVAMIGATAFFMGKDGVYHALNEVTANQTVAEFAINVYKNAIYYGTGFGYGFDQANKEMQKDYERQLQHGEADSLMKDIAVTGIKTVTYMGKNIVIGTMMLPDVIYEYLTGSKKAQRKEEMSKQFLAAVKEIAKTKLQIKNAEKMGKKVGIHPEDMLAFKECLCNSSSGGGMLGNHYGPGRGGACKADGPLTSWHMPMQIDKSSANRCSNSIAKINAAKNKEIFNKMHKEEASAREERKQAEIDEALYRKLVQMVQEENAKCVEEDLKKIHSLIYPQREGWEDLSIEAGDIYKNIQKLMLDKDKKSMQSILAPRLINAAQSKILKYSDFTAGIKAIELSNIIGGARTVNNNKRLEEYKRWEKPWNRVIRKTIPELKQQIREGKLTTVEKRREAILSKMSTRELPPSEDSRWFEINKLYNKKSLEMQKIATEAFLKIGKLIEEANPRAALKIIDNFPKWEKHTEGVTGQRSHVAQLVSKAKEYERKADSFVKIAKGHGVFNPSSYYYKAVSSYKKSLKIQKDIHVQRKLENLLKRHKTAILLQKDGDKQLKKHKLSKAISQYKRSIKYWPNKNLQNLINKIKSQLAQERREAKLKAKIAKLEREKARQEEEAMTNDGVDFANRFADRENRRSQVVEEKKTEDIYTQSARERDGQNEMLKRLKHNLEKMKKTMHKPVQPVAHAPAPQETYQHNSSSSSHETGSKPNNTSTDRPSKPTMFTLKGKWYSTDNKEKISGIFSIKLTGKNIIHVTYSGDDEDSFNAHIGADGRINLKDDDDGTTVFSGKIIKNSKGKIQGNGRWRLMDRNGIWTSTPVHKPSNTTQISTSGWNGIYVGRYEDKRTSSRSKKCSNRYGKLKIIVKGNTFSGDGYGSIDTKGHLHGRFNNGYKAEGSYLVFNNVIMGFIAGPKYCSASIELRKKR